MVSNRSLGAAADGVELVVSALVIGFRWARRGRVLLPQRYP